MAEMTPGPLIMMTQFVDFLAAMHQPGGLDPLLAATLGAILTICVIFMPCFLWIFVGAPFAERLRRKRALSASLTTITAAVVGVVLNLAIWFALHALFAELREVRVLTGVVELPVFVSIDIPALLLTLGAVVAVFRLKLSALPVLTGLPPSGLAFGSAASPEIAAPFHRYFPKGDGPTAARCGNSTTRPERTLKRAAMPPANGPTGFN